MWKPNHICIHILAIFFLFLSFSKIIQFNDELVFRLHETTVSTQWSSFSRIGFSQRAKKKLFRFFSYFVCAWLFFCAEIEKLKIEKFEREQQKEKKKHRNDSRWRKPKKKNEIIKYKPQSHTPTNKQHWKLFAIFGTVFLWLPLFLFRWFVQKRFLFMFSSKLNFHSRKIEENAETMNQRRELNERKRKKKRLFDYKIGLNTK